MKPELVPIYSGYVKPDKPLPLPLYNEDGNLMARKGVTLTHEKCVEILTNPRILTPKSELIEALDKFKLSNYKPEPDESDHAFKFAGSMERLLKLEKEYLQTIASSHNNLEKQVCSLAKRLEALVNQHQDACLASIFLRTTQSSIISASFATAILGAILTRAMHWADKERITFISAALTLEIANLTNQKNGSLFNLDPDLKDINDRKHISSSIEFLKNKGITHKKWLSYILTHHAYDPKMDSKEKSNIELDMAMSLMNLVHHYSCMVTGYGYEQIILPDVAVAYIFSDHNQRYQDYFARLFIKNIGKYPAGTLAKLKNGEMGIITKQGKDLLTPYIRLQIDSNGKPVRNKRVVQADKLMRKIDSTYFDHRTIKNIDISDIWR